MNLIKLIFAFLTFSMVLFGTLINLLEPYLPKFLCQVFRYGKFAYPEKVSNKIIEVPKSSFKHFYVFAVFYFTYMFYVINSVYIFNQPVPYWIEIALDIFCGSSRIATVPAIKVYLAFMLLLLQIYRRFYDTHFVSVFGRNAKINIFHYVVGVAHYPTIAAAILCEAPKFSPSKSSSLSLGDIGLWDIAAVAFFLWSWYHQHICTVILANLRKNEKGEIVSDKHKLPHGDLFKYLSAPHQTTEILMYYLLHLILNENSTYLYGLFWVLSNQVETILLSHWWYKKNFDNFPANRKALVPFIY